MSSSMSNAGWGNLVHTVGIGGNIAKSEMETLEVEKTRELPLTASIRLQKFKGTDVIVGMFCFQCFGVQVCPSNEGESSSAWVLRPRWRLGDKDYERILMLLDGKDTALFPVSEVLK